MVQVCRPEHLSKLWMCKTKQFPPCSFLFSPFTPKSDRFQFVCSLPRNITSHSMKNLDLHSLLRWNMIILPNSHYLTYRFIFKGWENVLFELGNERVSELPSYNPRYCYAISVTTLSVKFCFMWIVEWRSPDRSKRREVHSCGCSLSICRTDPGPWQGTSRKA